MMETSQVNRVELIVNERRKFVTYRAKDVSLSLQDNGKTIKIFLSEEDECL